MVQLREKNTKKAGNVNTDNWDEAIENINKDIIRASEINDHLSNIWIGSKDDDVKRHIEDVSRANGVLLVFLKRKLTEAEHFREKALKS